MALISRGRARRLTFVNDARLGRHERPIAPGPPGGPLTGSLTAFRRDPLATLLDATRRHGDVVRFRFGPRPAHVVMHLVNHPDHVKHVLTDRFDNYPKSRLTYQHIRSLLGRGLLTTNGEEWQEQRRRTHPSFHRRELDRMTELMTDSCQQTITHWEQRAGDGQPVELSGEMAALTVQMLGRCLFSRDLRVAAPTVIPAVVVVQEEVSRRAHSWLPNLLDLPLAVRYRKALATMDEIVYSLIRERRAQPQDTGDLLAVLLRGGDEVYRERGDQQVRDEVMTFLMAGHETSANALTWAWHLLSKDPEAQRRLRAELAEVLGGRAPTNADIPDLQYTKAVVQETMRLYPPVWALDRDAVDDDEIGGYHIPAGSTVIMSPYTMHRHPRYWDDAAVFDPGRFLSEDAPRPHYAYFPFGGGRRQCIGNNFATMTSTLALAMLAQRFSVLPDPHHRVEVAANITVRPRYGIRATVRPAERP